MIIHIDLKQWFEAVYRPIKQTIGNVFVASHNHGY